MDQMSFGDAEYTSKKQTRREGVLCRDGAGRFLEVAAELDRAVLPCRRHLLEENELAPEILRSVNAHLTRKGLMFKRGSIADATIIAVPSSTKNAKGKHGPEMHQTKKGSQVALRHEGAHWRRRRLGTGACGDDDAGQRS